MSIMNTIYLFDVDGTLTPARQKIEPDFEAFFLHFVENYPVYLISGSDMPKIQAQLTKPIMDACKGIFVCSGAEFWQDHICIEKQEHDFPQAMMDMVEEAIE